MKKQDDISVALHLDGDRAQQQSEHYPDTEGLGAAWFRDGESIGIIHHVNGPGAKAQPEFTATQYELEELTRLWVRTLLDIEFFCFSTGSSGSSEWRELGYAERRIRRLQRILGQEAVDRITNAVKCELAARFKGAKWDEFLKHR